MGPGTGFAPFAGFLDERAFQASRSDVQDVSVVGERLCYCGARLSDDVIYGEEIEKWRDVPGIRVQVGNAALSFFFFFVAIP